MMEETPEEFALSQAFGIEVSQEQIYARRDIKSLMRELQQLQHLQKEGQNVDGLVCLVWEAIKQHIEEGQTIGGFPESEWERSWREGEVIIFERSLVCTKENQKEHLSSKG